MWKRLPWSEEKITDSSTPVKQNAVSSIYVEDMTISSTPVTIHQVKGIVLTISNLPEPTRIYLDNQTKHATLV